MKTRRINLKLTVALHQLAKEHVTKKRTTLQAWLTKFIVRETASPLSREKGRAE